MPPRSGRFLTASARPASSTSTTFDALGVARPHPESSARRDMLEPSLTMSRTYKASVRPFRHLAPQPREQLAEPQPERDLERDVLGEPSELRHLTCGVRHPAAAQVRAIRRERALPPDVTEPTTEDELTQDR